MRSFVQGGNIDIAIVGGGATGVELAAELSRMVDLAAGYGEADIRRRLRLTLLESGPRILNAFPEAISASAASRLRAIGVDVRTGLGSSPLTRRAVMLDGGERVTAALKGVGGGAPVRPAASTKRAGTQPGGPGGGRPQPVGERRPVDLRLRRLRQLGARWGEAAAALNRPSCQPGGHAPELATCRLGCAGRTGATIPLPRPRRAGVSLAITMPLGRSAAAVLQGWTSSRAASRISVMPCFTDGTSYRCTAPARAALLWLAQPINALVQPDIRIS